MKALRCAIASLVLVSLSALLTGCGGPDLENPGTMTTEDTPEEQALYEEMKSETDELRREEDADD